MSKMQMLTRYDDVKDLGVIAIRNADTGDTRVIELGASEIEQTIWRLVEIRAHMKEEVPTSLDPNPRLGGVHDPIWQASLATFEGQSEKLPALAYRHRGLGWQTIHLSREQARKMGERMIELASLSGD